MDIFLIFIGIGLMYFLTFALNNVVETYMSYKYKIAIAERDTKKSEVELARITSN